jgi:hypothetical protein
MNDTTMTITPPYTVYLKAFAETLLARPPTKAQENQKSLVRDEEHLAFILGTIDAGDKKLKSRSDVDKEIRRLLEQGGA